VKGNIRNPYLNRVMIKNVEEFFGRKKELRRIFSRISASRPQSVSIVGIPRIGKSSLLYYISRVYEKFVDESDKYVFVMMDLQEKKISGRDGFFREAIYKLLKGSHFLKEENVSDFDSDTFLRLIEKLDSNGYKVIFLLDEFESITMNESFGEGFFSFLRSIANNFNCAYITSSSKELQKVCHTSKIADSPFFNIFSTLHLYPFSKEEAEELIAVPSEKVGLSLSPYRDKIIEMAGFFPLFLQIACSSFFENLMYSEGEISISEVEESFMEEAREHFRYYWDHFLNEEKNLLKFILSGKKVPENLIYLKGNLKKNGFIIETPDGKDALFSPFFEKFLKEEVGFLDSDTVTVEDSPFLEKGEMGMAFIGEKIYDWDLGGFKVLKKLGEGGMGVVYEAIDSVLGRKVAIKILHYRFLGDDTFKKRFLREAKYASRLNHPNICTIYQVGEFKGINYIVMEYIEGESLKNLLKAGPFKLIPALKMLIQIASGLQYAHKNGVIHRDVKSSNIMIQNDGLVKILDFGLVKVMGEKSSVDITGTDGIVGTPQYMSPEQISGGKIDGRSDIFSFGVVMYEVLNGYLPFSGRNYIELINSILNRPPLTMRENIGENVKYIIHKCLKKNPSHRFDNFNEVKKSLKEALNLLSSD